MLIMDIELKLLRVSRDLTLEEVSNATGLSINTILRLEKDEGKGQVVSLKTLYKFYGYELVPRKLEENE